MAVGAFLFGGLAVTGLVLMAIGIVFLVKNIKWKKQKEEQGISTTVNIVAIVLFSILIFFGFMWLLCFGLATVIFLVGF